MENGKSKARVILIAALLVAVLAAAGAAYPMLTQKSEGAQPVPVQTEEMRAESAVTVQPTAQSGALPTAAPDAQEAKPAEVAGPVMKNMAQDFICYDDEGNAYALSDMRGKPTVVNFFASWCGPCKVEMPYFEACYLAYGEQVNFMMVDLCAFGNDTKENAKALVAEGGLTFPVYFDTDGEAAMDYAIRSMPTTIFVSADGELKGRHTGMMDKATLESTIQAMIAE